MECIPWRRSPRPRRVFSSPYRHALMYIADTQNRYRFVLPSPPSATRVHRTSACPTSLLPGFDTLPTTIRDGLARVPPPRHGRPGERLMNPSGSTDAATPARVVDPTDQPAYAGFCWF